MSATYRDENEGLKLQLETLRERYREQSKSLAEPLRRLYTRRSARMLAGKVAIVGTALLALVAAFDMIQAGSIFPRWGHTKMSLDAENGGLSLMLLALLATVVIAYPAGLLLARGELTAKLARAISLTGDAHRDLAKLEAASPPVELRRLLAEQERRSISLPLVGALMLLPITLHFIVFVLCIASPFFGKNEPFASFDGWISLSVVLVTHAQLITAYMGSRFSRHLERYAEGEPIPPTKAGLTVFLATAASLVPGVFLDMNPPILIVGLVPSFIVALTGAAVIIPAFHVARRRFLAERALLAA